MQFNLTVLVSVMKSVFITLIFVHTPIIYASEMPLLSNGAVAKPLPVSGITIDGAISDWPTNFEEYPIALNYDGTPSASDFKAYFKVGYNIEEGALYVMLEVIDDDHIIDTSENSDWNTQDTWNFYLDPRHSIRGSGVNLFQYGMNFKDTTNSEISWDPEEKISS